jgi:hypothetical protein
MMMTNLRMTTIAMSVFFLLPVLATSLSATAQDAAQKTPPRTVSWFADHQQERAQVQLTCMDDPGHLANDPDCINAQQASIVVAARDAQDHIGKFASNDPAFWSAFPEARANKLIICRLDPATDYCDAAKRSLLIEAGKAER